MSAADNLLRWLRTDDPADRKPDVPHVEGCHQLDAEAVETALPAIQREAREAERSAIRDAVDGQKIYRLRGSDVVSLSAVHWLLRERSKADS